MKKLSWLGKLGPGLITGAADDDPSGIATYSQSGAKFGFDALWPVLLTTPLMIAIQIVSARLGVVTGRGLAANMRMLFPAAVTTTLVILLLIANTINIAADLAAMGHALALLVPGHAIYYTIAFGLLSLWLQVRIPFARYIRILKWLTLSLFVYVGVVFAVRIPWSQVLLRTLVPHFKFTAEYFTTIVAIFGTTISPYLFFWQTAQEVSEQEIDAKRQPLSKESGAKAANRATSEFQRIRIDTVTGMIMSNAIAFFIILSAAVTLHEQGVTNVNTAEQAATALRPIAGNFAFLLFSVGIIGTGILSISVLAGSAGYALCDALGKPAGLQRTFGGARAFYGVIVVTTVAAATLTFAPIDPIRMLYWAAVVNGVISAPILIALVLIARSKRLMKQFAIGGPLAWTAWFTVFLVVAATAGIFL